MDLLMTTMGDEARVLKDPAPTVICTDATAERVNLVGYCWTANADWLSAKSALWLALLAAIEEDQQVSMALPKQEVYLERPTST